MFLIVKKKIEMQLLNSDKEHNNMGVEYEVEFSLLPVPEHTSYMYIPLCIFLYVFVHNFYFNIAN